MNTMASDRLQRLAAAIAADSLFTGDAPTDVNVKARTFALRAYNAARTDSVGIKVAILNAVLTMSPGAGARATEAWGEPLSDEDGWLRFALVAWEEGLSKIEEEMREGDWLTVGAYPGVVMAPPWVVLSK